MRAADQFHAGIVVDDLEASLADLAELFGYEMVRADLRLDASGAS